MLALMAKHEVQLRVRYAETDQMGVVYHSNYLIWMEIGRVELVRSLGFNYKDLEQTDGVLLSVVEAQCRYLFPARYDDEITVVTEMAKANARAVEFTYEIVRTRDRKQLARGATKHFWLNREMRPTRLPEKYHAALTTE
jgi:acyl-CoA thioester hydrolase